jgi:hypothetical protein
VSNQITEQILGAWDDDESEASAEESPEVAEPVATTSEGEEDLVEAVAGDVTEDEDEEEEPKTPDEEGEVLVEEPGEEAEEEEEEAPEEEEAEPSGDEEVSAFHSDDPEVQALLARHNGDVEATLKAAANQRRLFGRQGQELGQAREHISRLEGELAQAALFRQGGAFITAEQQAWVEEAAGSENPLSYIQAAVEAEEYDLARAVLEQAEITPLQAMRLAQGIDMAQGRSTAALQPEQQQVLDHQALFTVLTDFYPDMPQFSEEMTATLARLGEDHPLASLARSHDPEEAAQGIIGLYEIARAKTATVTSTREQVKTKSRQAGDAARRSAQVSSAQATNAQAQTPRTRPIMPGLTLEALEAEFDAE